MLWGLLAVTALSSCEMRLEPGRYRCDPEGGGVCPQGWACLPLGTVYQCHPADDHVCGDGVLQPGEQCDGVEQLPGTCEDYGLSPGNLQCTSACTALCTACGNGIRETGPFGDGEPCDDGNRQERDGCSPDCRVEQPTWLRVAPAHAPPARAGHALVHDEIRGVVVLFGGRTGDTVRGDTWEYDGVTWTQVSPADAPSARWGHAMAYDGARGVVLLFGGSSTVAGTDGLSDTWEYDGVTWTRVSTARDPGPRLGAAMTHHPPRGETILFGGAHRGMHPPGTWAYDGQDWRLLAVQRAPADRVHASLTWCPAWQGLVLFGGSRSLAMPVSFDDAWIYRDGDWEALDTPTAPAARDRHAAYFDPRRQRLVVFGGIEQPAEDLAADAWELDGQRWSPVTTLGTPGARATAAVYLPDHATAVLFGGDTADASSAPGADTWWLQYQTGGAVCGNGVREAEEICDGTQIAPDYDLSCRTLGFAGGELGCRSDCRLDLSGCHH